MYLCAPKGKRLFLITFEMLQVLRCLGEEQGITQQVLAERIAKGKAALSNLIANLEKKKYVYRLEDASDRRNKRVYLSEEGALFYEQLRSSLDDIYASAGITVGMEKMKTLITVGMEKMKTLLADLKLTRDALEEI